MESNQIYSSMDDAQDDCTIFVVAIEDNETSMRLKLKGEYSLNIVDSGLFLLTLNTEQTLYHWPYTVLRRYGTSKTGFTFEAGRKSHSGPGVLRFASPSGKLITRNIKETVNRIKGDIPTPNSDHHNLGSSHNSNSFSEPISGDYTEFSHTTGRPNRARPKLPESNRELSLEIPGHYMNYNRITGSTTPHSVTIPHQTQTPRPVSPYHNTSMNSMVSPYGITRDRPAYNTVGNNAILMDSYSEISSLPPLQPPTSLNINQNVQLPSPRAGTPNILQTNPFAHISPTIPLPYNSMKRSIPTDTARTTEMLHKSCSSPGSTFPTCVSPLPGFDSGDDSGEEIEHNVSKKISQASTSVNELTANLDLTPAHSTGLQDYVNLDENSLNQLIRTVSNPMESRTVESVKSPNYMNVTRSTPRDDSDYYNITSEFIEEERKRSNTDTISPKLSFQMEGEDDFKFDLTAGAASLSGIQDLKIIEEDMLYGNVQYHPSSKKKHSEHLYMNTPTKTAAFKSVREHRSTEEIHKNTLNNSAVNNSASLTLPPSPTKSCLGASNSQPSITIGKSRLTKEKPISSQYSFLQDILPTSPKVPHAYTPWKDINTENKDRI